MLAKRDRRFLDVATALARVSPHHKAKLGAVIVSGREVLSTATNVRKSHPLQRYYNKFRNVEGDKHAHHLHAEINALIRLLDRKKAIGGAAYISRVCTDRAYGMARPCGACMQALIDSGIRKIFYTTEYGFAQEIIG